jgi:hypothetical protein
MKSRTIAHRIIEGEAFIVDTPTGLLHHLNPTGAAIWGWIDGRRSEEEISEMLCQSYEVDKATALADIRELLKELMEKNIILEAAHESRV